MTHAGGPTVGFGGAPYGATKRAKMPNLACGTHAGCPSGGLGGAPLWNHEVLYCACETTKLCRTHADGPTVGVGGAPYGATKRYTGR
eukprot:6097777-Pyramimonas_sp.AAC.1